MRDVKHATELVFELVRGPVALQATTGQVVVGKTAAPHDLGAVAVVFRGLQDCENALLHRAQQGFGDRVGEGHIVIVREIALHRVHHDVRDTGSRLVRRQGKGTAGVHDGEFGTAEVVGVTDLVVAVLVGDDARIAHLAAGGRDGQHAGDRQAGFRFRLAGIDVPHFAVERHAIGDCLQGIDDAAAADGQQEIDALAAAQFDALVDLGQARIGHDTAQLDHFQAA